MEAQMDWSPAELEDGELSECEEPASHKISFDINGKSTTKQSAFDDDALLQMEKRADRFGLNNKSDLFDDQLQQLYKSLYIITEEEIRHTQFDTVHINGTERMTSHDIFEYFFTHKPLFLEWIDENACYVVWKDNISAARAMVFYSKSIKYNDEVSGESNSQFENNTGTDAVNVADISATLPPGRWRVGAQHPKSDQLFLRFGNKSDKKLSEDEKLKLYSKKFNETPDSGEINSKISESMKSKIKSADSIMLKPDAKKKNPWGDLCKSWGINDSQEVFLEKNIPLPHLDSNYEGNKKSVKERIGLPPSVDRRNGTNIEMKSNNLKMRLGKRAHEQNTRVDSESESDSERTSDEEWKYKSKVPRMRMHADDEEIKIGKQKPTEKSVTKKSLNNITVQIENDDSPVDDDDDDDERFYERENIPSIRKNQRSKEVKSTIHSRLGARRESTESDDDSTDYSRNKTSIKKLVSSKNTESHSKTTVWSRLDVSRKKPTVQSESKSKRSENDLRSTISISKTNKTNVAKGGQDLRSRLKKDSRNTHKIVYSDSSE